MTAEEARELVRKALLDGLEAEIQVIDKKIKAKCEAGEYGLPINPADLPPMGSALREAILNWYTNNGFNIMYNEPNDFFYLDWYENTEEENPSEEDFTIGEIDEDFV